jgi:multiple sugar transport system ATP-binding protein
VAGIALEQVKKVYPDGTLAVSSIDLEIEDGQFGVLVGPSGCGKTTLLRMVAGLEPLTAGTIRIGGRDVSHVAARDRDIAMVFQNYALYPHMTVFANMAFALRRRKMRKDEIARRVNQAAGSLGLESQLHRKPRALSGGQRQRVAMGRAIVREPQAFLMDEPLSNLDAKLRAQTRAEIARIQRELNVTTIYVTHDQVEAMTLGHVVAVMNHGNLQQLAPPEELYSRPRNVFVAGFIGSPPMNLIHAELGQEDGRTVVRFGGHELPVPAAALRQLSGLGTLEGKPVILGIRPEDMFDPASNPPSGGELATLDAVVDLRESLGPVADLHFGVDARAAVPEEFARPEGAAADAAAAGDDADAAWSAESARFVARVDASSAISGPREGAVLGVRLDRLHFFDRDTGEALSHATDAAPPALSSSAAQAEP